MQEGVCVYMHVCFGGSGRQGVISESLQKVMEPREQNGLVWLEASGLDINAQKTGRWTSAQGSKFLPIASEISVAGKAPVAAEEPAWAG
jgi:hypothetical protein